MIKKILLALISFFSILSISKTEELDSIFSIGGAIRYNFIVENYESKTEPTDIYFTWDTWRINVDGTYKKLDLSFEYRFYPTFGTHFIHHGYFGYSFSDHVHAELGATQVPFGIVTYASHSW